MTAGAYDIALDFAIPRAQLVDYTVSCPGVEQQGSVGEPFDAYRTRRLAELRAQHEADRQQMAALTGMVVGAVAPRVRTTSSVATPNGNVAVESEARVNSGAVGRAVADGVIDDAVELPAGDVGQGRLAHTVHLVATGAGACVVTARADDANVLGGFTVTRIRDLEFEARQRAIVATSAAIDVRARWTARLVDLGADVNGRQHRAEAKAREVAESFATIEVHAHIETAAEAHARLEAEARLRAEAEVRARARHDAELRAQLVAHIHELAWTTRREYIVWLVTECHADPDRRARIAARLDGERIVREQRAERERRALELRLLAEREARAREAARIAEIAQRRVELAWNARVALRGYLVGLGAHERPPRPDPLAENPGAAPFAGAHWTSGRWEWNGATWIWNAGGWSDPEHFGVAGGDLRVELVAPEPVLVPFESPVIIDTTIRTNQPPSNQPVVRDHHGTPAPIVRDHRTEPPPHPAVRDHRHDKQDDKVVRDHR